jgi:hypothetical protein
MSVEILTGAGDTNWLQSDINKGSGTYVGAVALLHSKSDQTGAATHAEMPIMGIGAVALAAWRKASGITEGASFRRIRGSCLVEALELQGVRYIVNTLRPNVPSARKKLVSQTAGTPARPR